MSFTNDTLSPDLKSCEILLIEPEDRVETLETAKSTLVRYGRAESLELLQRYSQIALAQGKYVRELPIGLVRATQPRGKQAIESFMAGVNCYVSFEEQGRRISVKPVVVQFEGFDASKNISEVNPAGFLILPFTLADNMAGTGSFIPSDDFKQWVSNLTNRA